MLPYVAQIKSGLLAYRARENQILHIYNVLLRMSAVTLETCRGA
jgi:hypothetical protein